MGCINNYEYGPFPATDLLAFLRNLRMARSDTPDERTS